ncbi:hypothetical protein BC833DRAFT_459904 [Globomyces pollinis-pini]|nr:hypothetical protein BC833DRAFT_459904 [Globomyces pollinis-pini]
MESKDTSTSKPTSFSFGSKPDMKDSKLEETKETKPFSFGASLDKDSGPTFGKPPTFSFGAKPNESTSTTETKGFSFGAKASESASNTETKAFSFGAKASESASTTETKGFSFGAKTSESASTTETKGFSFGASLNKGESQATDKNSTEKPTAATGSGSFSFGSFTNKNTETVVKDSSDDKKESAPKPFSFGNDPSKKPSTGFDFSSKPAGSESKPSMFSFSNTQAPASNSTTSFGVSSTNSESKPFTFGSIPVATNSFSTSSTQGSASTGGTSGFSFQTAATATDSKNPTSTFNFSNLGTPKPLSSTFQFSLGTQPPVNTEATANAETTGGEEGDAMEALPQVGDALMKGEGEENEDTLNSIKVKIFTEGEAVGKWDSIGVGLLKLNQAKDKKSSRLLCRADQSGRVLINASVYSKMPIVKSNEKNFTIILQVEGEMKKFLIRSGKDSDLVGFFDNVTKVRDQL